MTTPSLPPIGQPAGAAPPSPPTVADRLTTAATVWGFRLGLSWLIGRRWLLLSTTSGTADQVRRTAVRYRWQDGVLVIPDQPGAGWSTDLQTRPVAMAQAAPGPLSVAAEFHEDRTITLPATGRPGPDPVLPDLIWVYPAALLLALGRRLLQPS